MANRWMGRETATGTLVDYFLVRWDLEGQQEPEWLLTLTRARKVFKLSVESGKWSKVQLVRKVSSVSMTYPTRVESSIVKEWEAAK